MRTRNTFGCPSTAEITEGLEFEDTIGVACQLLTQIADGSKIGDTVDYQLATFFFSILDGLKVGDAIGAVCEFGLDISDIAKIGDITSALTQFSMIISDGGTFAEVVSHAYANYYKISVKFTLKGRKTEFVIEGRLLDFIKKAEKADFIREGRLLDFVKKAEKKGFTLH